jgi:hypothetical protein
MTHDIPSDLDIPTIDVGAIRSLLAAELSLKARLVHVALLLIALAVAGVAGSLLLTEPDLPMRTQLAFAGIALIGLTWAGFATWVLTRRKILYARQQIVAGRMAVAFCTIFVIGALAAAVSLGSPRAAAGAAGFGLLLLGLAVGVLVRARRHHAALLHLRDVLEREAKTAG